MLSRRQTPITLRLILRRATEIAKFLFVAKVLLRAGALAPLRLAKITFSRIRPSPPIAIEDLSEFVQHFCSNPGAPAGKSFACGPSGSLFFPSSAHRGNFEQIWALHHHGKNFDPQLLKTYCLIARNSRSFGAVRELWSHEFRMLLAATTSWGSKRPLQPRQRN